MFYFVLHFCTCNMSLDFSYNIVTCQPSDVARTLVWEWLSVAKKGLPEVAASSYFPDHIFLACLQQRVCCLTSSWFGDLSTETWLPLRPGKHTETITLPRAVKNAPKSPLHRRGRLSNRLSWSSPKKCGPISYAP